MRAPRRATIEGGFSLVELMIAVTILFLVIGSVTMMGLASDRGYRTGATVAQLEEQTAAAMDRVAGELRTAGRETLEVLDGDSLSYAQALGFTGTVNWSASRRIDFELEDGELDDRLDNNGNGLVDEGRVVLTVDVGEATEARRVLTRWVAGLAEGELPNDLDDNGNGLIDEPGFWIEREEDSINVRLTLEKVDAGGRRLRRTARTAIRPRN